MHRDAVLGVLARYPVSDPRIVGSTARGDDADGDELDLLVHVDEAISYFALASLVMDLESVLGCAVDLGEDDVVRVHTRALVLGDARPL